MRPKKTAARKVGRKFSVSESERIGNAVKEKRSG